MPTDRLTIEFDGDDGWVAFRTAREPGGESSARLFKLPDGFTPHHVLAAAVATGWVFERSGQYWIDSRITCKLLVDYLDEMFEYFKAPGEAGSRLDRVKQQIDDCLADDDDRPALSMWTYAWLDLALRDDVADEARNTDGLWRKPSLTLDLDRHRESRLQEVLRRHAAPPEAREVRMAPSSRARRGASPRDAEAG
ncbi:MAG: hypothetical protein ACYTG0_35140 [Planctomycetota bacterium]|jgi:hypothetical protein